MEYSNRLYFCSLQNDELSRSPAEYGEENLGLKLPEESDTVAEAIEYKDEGYINLVLKVLAQMCDGQFVGLQVEKKANFKFIVQSPWNH